MAFKVGVSRIDITPNYNSPTRRWHVGGDRGRLKTFHDRLYAKTIAFSDGYVTSTLTSMDVAVLYKAQLDFIRKTAREMLPCPVESIVLHCTHQHSDSFIEYEPAYDVFGINDVAFDMDYIASIPKKVATSIVLAVQNLMPALMGYKSGAITKGIASNRRIIDEEGNLVWRASRGSEFLRTLPMGHIDPEVGVVALTQPDGKPIATLINYACHPSSAGGDSPNCCSADFPGFATEIVDRISGGTTVFLHGCSGDINPGKYVRGEVDSVEDRIGDARRMGQILAGEVIKTLGLITPQEVSCFRSVQKDTVLPVQPSAGDEQECLMSARRAITQWRESGEDPRTALRKYIISRKIENGTCPVTISAFRMNDLALACIPGEPFTALGEKIKRGSGARMALVAATCGEDPFYIPTPEAIDQGGYETTHIASRETGDELVRQVLTLLGTIGDGSSES